jgi:hypothetical protein
MYRCWKTELEWHRYAGNDASGNLLGIVEKMTGRRIMNSSPPMRE